MLALPSVPSPSDARRPDPPLAAIVYPNEAYPQSIFERIVADCRARGLRIAGTLQHAAGVDATGRCDVVLEDLGPDGAPACFKTAAPVQEDADSMSRPWPR